MTTATFDIARLVRRMQQDPSLAGLDFDRFGKRLTQALAAHGPALAEIDRHADAMYAERVRSRAHDDPEQLRQRFLQAELRRTGVDWQRFATAVAMMAAGIMAFRTKGATAALHAHNQDQSTLLAIIAGIYADGELGGVSRIAGNLLAYLNYSQSLSLDPSSQILSVLINQTRCGMLIGDHYELHGNPPRLPTIASPAYTGVTEVTAPAQLRIGGAGATFLGFYYQTGNPGLVGVNAAYKLTLAPRRDDPNQSTGLRPGQAIYAGHAIEKIGGTYIGAGLTGDPNARAYDDSNRVRGERRLRQQRQPGRRGPARRVHAVEHDRQEQVRARRRHRAHGRLTVAPRGVRATYASTQSHPFHSNHRFACTFIQGRSIP